MMKYIVISDGKHEYPIIFPQPLVHKQVAQAIEDAFYRNEGVGDDLTVISAGFCDGFDNLRCDSESESLNVKSRGQTDQLLIDNPPNYFL